MQKAVPCWDEDSQHDAEGDQSSDFWILYMLHWF